MTDTDWQRLAGRLYEALTTALIESEYAASNRRRRLLTKDPFTYVEEVLHEYERAVAPEVRPPEDGIIWPDSREASEID